MRNLLLSALAVASLAAVSQASIIVTPVATPSTAVPGYVINDLNITTTTDWQYNEVIAKLTSGNMYLDALGGSHNAPPNPAIVTVFPTLGSDSFVKGYGPTESASFAGAAVTITPGARPQEFDANGIDLNWFTSSTTDIGPALYGQFTFSNDANGSFQLLVQTNGGEKLLQTYNIKNGVVGAVPEPASLSLLSLGALGLLARRRKA